MAFPAAGPETAPIQADGGDNRKTVCHEKVAVEDISDEQSDEQPSLPMQPASSESSESGATEQEFPGRHDFRRRDIQTYIW